MSAHPPKFTTIYGALWMTASAVCMTATICLIRISTAELHPFQVVFFRNFFGFLLLLPWLMVVDARNLRVRQMGLYWIRAGFAVGAMLAWFYALSVMPIVEAAALNFTKPLFATVGAMLFLGEIMRPHRWGVASIGLLGVLVMLRPGFDAVHPVASLVLLSSALAAAATLISKVLLRRDAVSTVLLYNMFLLILLSLIPALFVWQWPDSNSLMIVFGIAVTGTLGGLCVFRALRATDASAVMPFAYVRLPMIALMGYFLFSETMDAWNWLGAAVIIGAALWLAHREA